MVGSSEIPNPLLFAVRDRYDLPVFRKKSREPGSFSALKFLVTIRFPPLRLAQGRDCTQTIIRSRTVIDLLICHKRLLFIIPAPLGLLAGQVNAAQPAIDAAL